MPVKTALLVLGGLALLAASAPAHGIDDNPVLVVDTDAGLDDLVALAMTLQHARVKLAAIVVTEGACGRERGVGYVERLVDRFNRRDVALYAGTDGSSRPPPPFRASAERLVGKVLPDPVPPFHRAFAPGAYGVARRKATVLVLGPLTSLAAALRAEPGLRDGIAEILVAGPAGGFNLSRDPEALETVRKSGLPIELVAPGPAAAKPTAWREAAPKLGRGTSVGEAFLAQLLADAEVRRHYVEKLPVLYDELAFLFYVDAAPFARTDGNGVFAPRDRKAVRARFAELITRGRQRNTRVVLADRALPDGMLRPDVRARREAILRKNGEEEWFSVLLLTRCTSTSAPTPSSASRWGFARPRS
jgi:inosine-uridine nucleoside N-ribohydrolase